MTRFFALLMGRLHLGSLLAALAVWFAACSPFGDRAASRATAAPDVVLLVVDGLRVDRLDALLEAPAAEELATSWTGSDVVRFERAYSPSSLAEQSLASLFSGRLPTHGGGIGLAEAQPSEEATPLAVRLRRAGYRTGFVSQQAWAGRPGFTRGFDGLYVANAAAGARQALADVALRIVAEELGAAPGARHSRSPFLLVVHWATPDLRAKTEATETSVPAEEIARAYDDAVLESLRDAGSLLQGLAGRGALERAAIVLTSSHGFELLEHGGVGAGFTLHEEVVRVPLWIRHPGLEEATIPAPVSTVRLLPTLLRLAEAEANQDPSDAAPFPLALEPAGARAPPVVTELVVRERAIARAVIDGADKYLQVLRDAPLADREVIAAGYEELQAAMSSGAVPTPALFGEPVREELLRLREDSLVEEGLALSENAELLSRMRALLRDYERLCESTGFAPPAVASRMPIDPNDVRRLEALGYM
jgi:hypothetical protein